MAIASLDDYRAAVKQKIFFLKTGLSANNFPFTSSGTPPAGTLAAGNTTTGITPTDAVTGYPPINSFAGGAQGYLTRCDFVTSNASSQWGLLFDQLWKSGDHTFGTNFPMTTSNVGRVPGSDFKGLQLWIEVVTAMVGTAVITIDYRDDADVAQVASITLPAAAGANTIHRVSIPSHGIRRVTNIVEAGATGGTYNVAINRLLSRINYKYFGGSDRGCPPPDAVQDNPNACGWQEVYDNSALAIYWSNTSGSRANEVWIEVASR